MPLTTQIGIIAALLKPAESLVFGGDAELRGTVGTLVVGDWVGGEGGVGRVVGRSAGGRDGTWVKRTGDREGLVGDATGAAVA